MVAFACSGRARAARPEATGPSAIGGFVRISQEGGISLVMPSVEMVRVSIPPKRLCWPRNSTYASIRSWRLPLRPTRRFTRSLSSRAS